MMIPKQLCIIPESMMCPSNSTARDIVILLDREEKRKRLCLRRKRVIQSTTVSSPAETQFSGAGSTDVATTATNGPGFGGGVAIAGIVLGA